MKRNVSITFAALFTAVISLLAQISFVTPGVPITLQVLGIALCGYTLSLKWAVGCVVTYIGIGCLGLPVFSSFQGGIQWLLGPTGGFIFGFVFLAFCCSLSQSFKNKWIKLLLSAMGIILCHTLGIIQYAFVTGCGIFLSLITVSLPFLIKDIALVIAAYYMSEFVKKRLINFKT